MGEPIQAASFHDAVIAATARLEQLHLADQTTRAMQQAWRRLSVFAARSGVGGADDVTPALVESFVRARSADGSAPTVVAMHWRRSAVRLLFRVLRELSLATGDPTLDLALPRRSRLTVRPLTDDEIALCRWASLASASETRLPAVWALAEAGATSAEIPHVLVKDLRRSTDSVMIPGSSKTDARQVPLTEWGATQLARRAQKLEHRRFAPLVYEGQGSPESAQSSVSGAIGDILRRAGLGDEPDVRPRSVTAWVGRSVFAETKRIEVVARRLGMRSLDRTAALIGWWEWRTE